MSSDSQPSTLNSIVEQAQGLVSSAIGAVTGNTADKAEADQHKAKAQAESDASHAGATLGGVSISASGVAANDPNRQEGSWNQTLGSAKETIGGLVGSESLKQQGADQNAQGRAQEAQGQLSDLGSGIADRVQGTVGGAVASLTGNEQAKQASQDQHDKGKTLQRGVESELQKAADAADKSGMKNEKLGIP